MGTKKCKIILKEGKNDAKRSYFAKYSCFGGIYVTKDYGKTSSNVKTYCKANCRRIHKVAL